MKIKDMNPADYNPRKITDEKLNMLGNAMREFGDLSGVVMNVQTGNVICGHQRLKHFDSSWQIRKRSHKDAVGTIAIGEIESPFGVWQYREVDWPIEKEMAANVAANKHGGEFDEPKLKDLLTNIYDAGIEMTLTGFDADEVSLLMDPLVPELKYKEMELKPYRMTHVLISFPPEKIIKIQEYLEKIMVVKGVEIEQGSN